MAEKLRPLVVDLIPYLNKAIKEGKKVLVEGAQSNILDIDFGKLVFIISRNWLSKVDNALDFDLEVPGSFLSRSVLRHDTISLAHALSHN